MDDKTAARKLNDLLGELAAALADEWRIELNMYGDESQGEVCMSLIGPSGSTVDVDADGDMFESMRQLARASVEITQEETDDAVGH